MATVFIIVRSADAQENTPSEDFSLSESNVFPEEKSSIQGRGAFLKTQRSPPVLVYQVKQNSPNQGFKWGKNQGVL